MEPESDEPGALTPPGPRIETDGPAGTSWQPTGEAWHEARRTVGADSATNRYGAYHAPVPYRAPPSTAMASWALGLSLAFCIPLAFVVGAGLAVAVLVRSRDGRDHGRGRAIAALVIAAVLVLVNVVYVVVVLLAGVDETQRDADGRVVEGGTVTLDRLRVGDCFSDGGMDDLPTDGTDGQSEGVADVVPCDEPHQAEVFHEIDLGDGEFPGEQVINRRTEDCLPAFRAYVGKPFRASELDVIFYFPTSMAWRLGDRKITCSLAAVDLSDLTGSMRGSRR